VAIEENFLREITDVRSSLVFFDFEADPDTITDALGIQPDDIRRKGDLRTLADGHQFRVPHNLWVLESRAESLDPNDQIRDVLARIEGVLDKIDSAWNPVFNILWKSKTLGAGAGPYYEKDVIQGIARIGAEIYQDLYTADEE
jgi:hypothetical protein